MTEIWPYLSFFDWKLLLSIAVLAVPLLLVAGVRAFGSLTEFWNAWRSTWRTPAEIAEDTAKDVLSPLSTRTAYRDRLRGDFRMHMFLFWYGLAVLAAYSFVRHQLPAVARVLSGW
jgi:hypothetical protein